MYCIACFLSPANLGSVFFPFIGSTLGESRTPGKILLHYRKVSLLFSYAAKHRGEALNAVLIPKQTQSAGSSMLMSPERLQYAARLAFEKPSSISKGCG